jgi:hypothetical protein
MTLVKPRSEYLIIAAAVVVKTALQLLATANSGYHGDELLHIEAGKHLAAGYLDFPPFIGILSYLQNIFHSDSLFVNHLFNYLNSALILVFAGLTTMKAGGKKTAVLITVSAIIFSAGFGASQYLFLPTAFEQLFWIVFIYLVICISSRPVAINLILAAVCAALGFLTKYSFLFVLAGFAISVLIFHIAFLKRSFTWIAVLILLLLISPNLLWQSNNGFPVFHHMSELYRTQLESRSFAGEFTILTIFLNPISFIIWIVPLIFLPFLKKYKNLRLPLFTLLLSFVFLIAAKGKSYYYFPVILGLIPFGSVWLEEKLLNRRAALTLYLSVLILTGILMLPEGMPLLKLKPYLSIYHPKPGKDNKTPLPFENYYSGEIWGKMLETIDSTYSGLPEAEKKTCLVWGRHYSMAGGVNLMGQRYGLPHAFSFHSSFYTWVPAFSRDITVIAIGESDWELSHWEKYFREVREIKVIENPYASEPCWYQYRVFLCRSAIYDSDQLKELFKNEIF